MKTWRIDHCGWDTYFAEVATLSRGRTDVCIECHRAGVISLVKIAEAKPLYTLESPSTKWLRTGHL